MKKNYLLFATLSYSLPVLRPLQAAIRARGDEAAWFVDDDACRSKIEPGERLLRTVQEVMEFNPVAVFTCGNDMYDFFPGVKVQLFHGYACNKRGDRVDDHFAIRGWFDIYCTQGPSSTPTFERLARKLGYFRVYETGWPKADTYFSDEMQRLPRNGRPVILYSTTFTRQLTSTTVLADEIERLAAARDWEWIFMFHPKLTDPEILGRYERMAAEHPNVTYLGNTFDASAMRRADAMLCDSSSIVLEFMFLGKPVVTCRNTQPGPHLIDIREPQELEAALERALSRPPELLDRIREHTLRHEAHRDGRCSERVLEAVDDFLARGGEGLRPKPLNLLRKWKMRRKLHYWPLLERMRRNGKAQAGGASAEAGK